MFFVLAGVGALLELVARVLRAGELSRPRWRFARRSGTGGRVSAPVVEAARVAFTFVMMNYAAVAGLFAAARGRRIWR